MTDSLATVAWQFNEAVSMLREASATCAPGIRQEIEEGLPAIQEALERCVALAQLERCAALAQGEGSTPAWATDEGPDSRLYTESERFVAGALSTIPPFTQFHPEWALPHARQALDAISEWEPSDASSPADLPADTPERAALAHDQQDEPDDDEPEQVQLAMVPLPGNGRYSVTVKHQADRGEDHYQTREWEVWAKDGNVRVEPMTYPEPGVSDTPEPPPEPCKTCQDRGWVWEGNASAGEGTPADCPDPVHASDYASAGNPPVELTGGLDDLPADTPEPELDDRAEFGVTQAELNVINDDVQAEAELDDLLARADESLSPLLAASNSPGGVGYINKLAARRAADLIRDLAAALRDARRKSSVEIRHLIDKCDRLERELAEARPHGEVLARVTTQSSGYARRLPDGSFDADDGGTTSRLPHIYHLAAPPGTDVLVVWPVEDTDT